jgi:hypothetical protein
MACPEERADLVAFLAALGRPGAFDAAKGGVARSWNLYLVTARNEHVGVERVVQGNLTLEDCGANIGAGGRSVAQRGHAAKFPGAE